MKLISVTTSIYGFHQWKDAGVERSYLAHRHRHLFIITAYCRVSGSDREIEFHDLKHRLNRALPGTPNLEGVHDFGHMSCEHIGEAILEAIPELVKVEVSEDGECSAIITREEKKATGVKPYVVTLCGSTKFREEYEMAAYILEKLGIAVLSVGGFMHAHNLETTKEQKMAFDKLHISKISMSDGIVVLNREGYIGRSTASEMNFARDTRKDIFLLEGDIPEKNIIHIHPDASKYEQFWSGELQLHFIIRDSAMEFAKSMENKLAKNDEKGGWEGRDVHPDLYDRLIGETEELRDAIARKDSSDIMDEAIDVGNFAMMIFDNVKNRRGGS